MHFLIVFLLNLTVLNYLFNLLEKIDSSRILEYSYTNLAYNDPGTYQGSQKT